MTKNLTITFFTKAALTAFLISTLTGCWAVAGGAGAEAGYVASQKDKTVGQIVDDQLIVSSIKTKLLADSEVSGLDINVDSDKGVVTLKGVVKSQHEAEKAITLATQVNGVKDVRSKLYVD